MTGIVDKTKFDDMCKRYRGGETQSEIGRVYAITGQAVSAIFKHHGFSTASGGAAKRRADRIAYQLAEKNKKTITQTGFEANKYRELVRNGARRRFTEQQNKANQRGIIWSLSFYDWWTIWDQSGKFLLRGRGDGQYVMARKNDSGAYQTGNVEIITHSQNIKDGFKNRKIKRENEVCKK